MIIKKILDENNSENTIVHVIFIDNFKEKSECAGVLVREDDDQVRIVFNAKNDKAIDYLDIKKSKIVKINILDFSNIKYI